MRSVVGLLLCLFLAPARGTAQRPPGEPPRTEPPTPGWVGEFATFSANALLGGVTAGITQKLRGGSFQDGFTRGTLGGSVIYAGKRLSVERFDGAGLLGREVAAVGASVVRNAADGRPSLERLMFPVGPVRLYVTRGARTQVRAKADLTTLFWTTYAAFTPELEWDAGSSLSAGAPVFRVPDRLIVFRGDSAHAAGLALTGTLFLSDIRGIDTRETFAHERVHIIQHDQIFFTITEPLEGWALRQLPGGATLHRYADLNTASLAIGVLAPLFGDYAGRPWELEANFLMRR